MVGGLPDDVPQRDFEGPKPARMKVDRLDRSHVLLDRAGVLADEQVFVTRESIHGIPRADSGDSGISFHEHEGGVEFAPRNWVPGGMKRWFELQFIALEPDVRDLQNAPS